MKTYIYILQDPITQEVRYVGKSNNPKRRYTSHLCDKPKVKYYSYYWIQSLLKKGLKPKPESILKMKETIKNRVITDEWRKNMSKSANNKGSNNGNTKLTEDVVIEIKKRLLTNSAMEVANEFNLTYTIVWKIKKGQTWKNV